jgi:hypothetical protein
VHLAEVYASQDDTDSAGALLRLALSSRDPELQWRLADVLLAQKRFGEAEKELDAARLRFDQLLERHPLAFADHGRSSMLAAVTTAGGRSNSPARMSRIARHAERSSRPRRSRWDAYEDQPEINA